MISWGEVGVKRLKGRFYRCKVGVNLRNWRGWGGAVLFFRVELLGCFGTCLWGHAVKEAILWLVQRPLLSLTNLRSCAPNGFTRWDLRLQVGFCANPVTALATQQRVATNDFGYSLDLCCIQVGFRLCTKLHTFESPSTLQVRTPQSITTSMASDRDPLQAVC